MCAQPISGFQISKVFKAQNDLCPWKVFSHDLPGLCRIFQKPFCPKKNLHMSVEKKHRTEGPSTAGIRQRMREDWPTVPPTAASDPKALADILYPHDLPHANAGIEWWYISGHFGPERRFSVFGAFFRAQHDTSGSIHALNWAVTDTKVGKYFRFGGLESKSPALYVKLMADAKGDPFVLQSLKDMFNLGKVPVPDRIMPVGSKKESMTELDLTLDECRFARVASLDKSALPVYELTLKGSTNDIGAAQTTISFVVNIQPKHGPSLHGRDGIMSIGQWQHDMFYYFSPFASWQATYPRHSPSSDHSTL